jgi:hypothetical protein
VQIELDTMEMKQEIRELKKTAEVLREALERGDGESTKYTPLRLQKSFHRSQTKNSRKLSKSTLHLEPWIHLEVEGSVSDSDVYDGKKSSLRKKDTEFKWDQSSPVSRCRKMSCFEHQQSGKWKWKDAKTSVRSSALSKSIKRLSIDEACESNDTDDTEMLSPWNDVNDDVNAKVNLGFQVIPE